jgi:hypothetical protein
MSHATSSPETDVPSGETPPEQCPYCEQPFRTERLLALHLGEVHDEVLTDAQRRVYEDAFEAESDELFIYHLKVIGALIVVYFFVTYAYAFAWA